MEKLEAFRSSLISNKKAIVGGLIILVLLIVVLLASQNKKVSVSDNLRENEKEVQDTSGSEMPTTSSGSYSISAETGAVLTRKEALATYSQKIIRITDVCLTEPYAHTFNLIPGTIVMVDNDADTSNTIRLPSRTLTLAAHHYTLEKINDGGVVSSTCDPSTNITTVTVSIIEG